MLVSGGVIGDTSSNAWFSIVILVFRLGESFQSDTMRSPITGRHFECFSEEGRFFHGIVGKGEMEPSDHMKTF